MHIKCIIINATNSSKLKKKKLIPRMQWDFNTSTLINILYPNNKVYEKNRLRTGRNNIEFNNYL